MNCLPHPEAAPVYDGKGTIIKRTNFADTNL
jgi:hypothetical protein